MFDFAEKTSGMSAIEVLNYYRNLYYVEPQVTERGIVANAINNVMNTIGNQKAEIEQLKRNYDALKYQENLSNRHCRNICEPKYKAEIERLKENLNIELEKYATEYDNTIKAEAYKEFADMIKKNIKEVWNYDNGTCSCVLVLTKDIDNLLKEMVGNKLNFQK